MDKRVLFAILTYYSLIVLLFFVLDDVGSVEYSFNRTINASGYSDVENLESGSALGGFMGAGITLTRFVGFIFIGIGLPESTPFWFSVIWTTWSIMLSVLILGFLINSIWSGGS